MAEIATLTGKTIAHYRILEKLGAGGMGEVYRAADSHLGRDVAVKILPELFATDQQRVARFEREAHLLAALNHPNIATIHGLEAAGTTRALVMELVPGPTLADRIAQAPLPLEEALPIARQIAEALEYAHERGIIHRDLKPANIKLTPDGAVKLLDFGLAKALDDSPAAQDSSNSPTISALATRAGLILGTAAYMSPEQAKGAAVDRRADIWAFGVVLSEMLTGQPLFAEKSVQETIARLLREDPRWETLPPGTPLPIRRLLERCLRKDPKQRLRDVGDARIAIEEFLANPAPSGGLAGASVAATLPIWRRALPWVLAASCTLLAVFGFWRPWSRSGPAGADISIRLSTELGAEGALWTGYGSSVVLSPDGTRIVFVVQDSSGKQSLLVRDLNQLQATALSGTDGAYDPFFSPDGEWIGFFTAGRLKKISSLGGTSITLCDLGTNRGGTWGEDGTIIFAPSDGEGLSRVSSAGGKPEPLTKLDPATNEVTHRWPQILPGGKAVLFTAGSNFDSFEDANLEIQVLPSGLKQTVYRGGYYGRYLRNGYLVFLHRGTLFAVPFDLKRLKTKGQAVPIVPEVMSDPDTGGAQFSVSATGTLAYLPGKHGGNLLSIAWMDRDGKTQPMRLKAGEISDIQFSPDGKRLAFGAREGSRTDIWTYDWQRDTLARLTFGGESNYTPVWTPDGQRITYSMSDNGAVNLYWKRADGSGDAQRLTDFRGIQSYGSWSPDGKILAFNANVSGSPTGWDIYTLAMEQDEKRDWKPDKPKLFLGTPAGEVLPAFSPDGHWLAYTSNDSGAEEVYVRPFPGPGGKWQISSGGGRKAEWSRTNKELLYMAPGQQIMYVTYSSTADSFQAGKAQLWADGRSTEFALHPDGKRVAVLKAAGAETEQQFNKVVFVFNFFDELRRKVGKNQ